MLTNELAQCTTLQHYAITQACFNISSDAFMLGISLPLLLNTSLQNKQKIILTGIFGMGLFVIIAAILTKVFNLADLYSTVYMLWYVRESSVAVWVTNLPLIWPLLRETFPMLRSFTPGIRAYSGSRSKMKGYYGGSENPTTGGIGVKTSTHISVTDRGFQLDTLRRKRGESSVSLDSDERELNGKYTGDMGGISTHTTVEVEEHSLRNLEQGDLSDGRLNGWEHESEDHGYQVRIIGPGRSVTADDGPMTESQHSQHLDGRSS